MIMFSKGPGYIMLKPGQNGNPPIRHMLIAVCFFKFSVYYICQLAWSFINGIPINH